MADEDELERLREEKMKELQERDEGEAQEQKQRAEAQKKAVLRKSLEPEARERLQGKIDEEQMKQILKELQPDSDDYDIKHTGL